MIAATQQQAAIALAAALNLTPGEARREAQILLGHALGKPRAWLIAHDREALDAGAAHIFQTLLNRRLNGEPIAYLVGEREFYGHAFKVTPAVLIPRPETELLVELALERLPVDMPARALDLGAGSGTVAVSLALARPAARVTAVELSPAALAVAQDNAQRLGAANLEFRLGFWYAPLEKGERFEVIVSNPPYIAADDPHLGWGDLRFEPPGALASGPDGLADIRLIVDGAPAFLAPGGWLLFEHGYDQAEACRKLLNDAGFSAVASVADLAGIERVTLGCLGAKN
ncbi:MAG: peptide chain release factor N(5)-glutamine methyltransferase [Sulfuricella sp.]|nr:peptide chain release factor N(5)-glutamine methyltransferase [Sulfuricella sp.]